MKLTKKEKEIIKEDIKDLRFLVKKYTREGKENKASECLKELAQLEEKIYNK